MGLDDDDDAAQTAAVSRRVEERMRKMEEKGRSEREQALKREREEKQRQRQKDVGSRSRRRVANPSLIWQEDFRARQAKQQQRATSTPVTSAPHRDSRRWLRNLRRLGTDY